ncbi:MAG: Cof-type HAD-IIB family hydrolase [Faecalibacillus sp.]
MKYVFFDIDGTLRGKSRVITDKTKEAIHKLREKGNKAFLCTGRAPVSITDDILEIGFDGVISSAGSFIQIHDQYIYENCLDPELLEKAIVLFVNAKVGFTLETKDYLYQSVEAKEFLARRRKKDEAVNPELARFYEQRDNNPRLRPISEFDVSKDKVTKIVFISYDKYALLDLVPHLSKDFHVVLFSQMEDDFINGEIIDKDCTKADAIERVVQYYQGNMEDTIAYGDSMNDYQMLEKAHLGIVYEGAKDKLLDIAFDTFIDPDQDGIALSLEKLQLI